MAMSSRSATPRPWMADTGMGSPRPNRPKAAASLAIVSLSALLAATTTCSPTGRSRSATAASSVEMVPWASTTNTIRSAAAMASSAWARMSSTNSASALHCHPPVSITPNARPAHSASNSRRSRVTPGFSWTTAALQPTIRLTRVDLPTLGRPTTAMRGLELSTTDGHPLRIEGSRRPVYESWPPGGRGLRFWSRVGVPTVRATRPSVRENRSNGRPPRPLPPPPPIPGPDHGRASPGAGDRGSSGVCSGGGC